MSDATERRARRIERVRGEIMDAAIEIIGEKGFKNTTAKEIAVRADMAEGTLYNYFKNKDDILMSIAERYVNHKRNLDVRTDVSSMQEFITEIYSRQNIQDMEQHMNERMILKALLPEFLTDKTLGKMYFERIVQPYFDAMEEKLGELVEKGIAVDYDVKILSRILYSSMIGFAILEINKDPVVTDASDDFRRETGKAYIEILGKGLSP